MRRLSTVHGVLDRRMVDESIDGREPKLSFGQTVERGAIGIGRHVKVKSPDGGERASIALGLHDDERDYRIAGVAARVLYDELLAH